MNTRRLTWLAGFVAVALSLAGCGGDDEAPAGERKLTKAEYAREANALCQVDRERVRDEVESFMKGRDSAGRTSEEAAKKAIGEVVLDGFRSQYEGLRRLFPPRGDEDFLDLMLSTFSRSLEEGEEDVWKLFREEPSGYTEFGEGTVMAMEYGIRWCGSLNLSARGLVTDLKSPPRRSYLPAA
jgi:hypothetical protein